jgi:hypothetical protein
LLYTFNSFTISEFLFLVIGIVIFKNIYLGSLIASGMLKNIYLVLFCVTVFSCENKDEKRSEENESDIDIITEENKSLSLKFIGEQIIPDGELFEGEIVGGLSGIDYKDGFYYLICDSHESPIRFYKADLTFDETSFSSVEILEQVELLTKEGKSFEKNTADPESIIFDTSTNEIVWTSEGYADEGINPFVRTASVEGIFLKEFTLPTIFEADGNSTTMGPRANGVFESLTLSIDNAGYWTATELPLKQDGEEPVYDTDTNSPVRFAYIDKASGAFQKQFAYKLDKVAREVLIAGLGFTVNGVADILQYEQNKFLVIERSFTTGTSDGGITLKLYDVDSSNATDVSEVESLYGASYTPAEKTLVLNFEEIRSQLSTIPGGTEPIVDNIEGITFGPDLPNGNKSVIIVSDNNFSSATVQLNQFIVFELLED